MKVINQNSVFLAVVCIVSLCGCFKDRIELDLNNQENKKVVITGWLNNIDDNQFVQLTYSTDYLDDEVAESINDAEVTLRYNSQAILLEHSSNGIYLLPPDWKGEINEEYTLSAIHQEVEYQAVSLLRAVPEIQDIEAIGYFEEDSLSYYEIYFGFQETAGEGDGYFAIDYLKNSDQKNIIRTCGWADDEFADGEYYEGLTVTSNEHQLGDTIILEVHSIGIKATEYFQSIDTEIFREGFLDPPPVNVPTNFSNGAVGYFLTSGKRQYEIVIE